MKKLQEGTLEDTLLLKVFQTFRTINETINQLNERTMFLRMRRPCPVTSETLIKQAIAIEEDKIQPGKGILEQEAVKLYYQNG